MFLISMLVMAVSAVPLGLVSSVGTFATGHGACGMTTGLTDMLGNGRIAELEAQHDAALMNLNHAFFSFAYAGAAMLTGFAREAEVAPAALVHFDCGARSCVLTMAGRDRGLFRARAALPDPKGAPGRLALHAWLAGGVSCWSRSSWRTRPRSGRHCISSARLAAARPKARFGPAMLGLTMGIGRLLGHLVTSRGEPRC
jgi:hypothetical protein